MIKSFLCCSQTISSMMAWWHNPVLKLQNFCSVHKLSEALKVSSSSWKLNSVLMVDVHNYFNFLSARTQLNLCKTVVCSPA